MSSTIVFPSVHFTEAISAFKKQTIPFIPYGSFVNKQDGTCQPGIFPGNPEYSVPLELIQQALLWALEGGYTFPQFKKKLIPALKKAHWWRERAKAGDDERTLFQNGILQLETIFHANMRISFAQGHWEQQQKIKDRFSYLRYEGILDSKIRPQHRNWDSVILPIDHPWWETHYPPNGWKCRCAVLSISDDDLERFGWQVSETPVDGGAVTWVNSLTDEVLEVPDGIDPGWACHAGATSPSV